MTPWLHGSYPCQNAPHLQLRGGGMRRCADNYKRTIDTNLVCFSCTTTATTTTIDYAIANVPVFELLIFHLTVARLALAVDHTEGPKSGCLRGDTPVSTQALFIWFLITRLSFAAASRSACLCVLTKHTGGTEWSWYDHLFLGSLWIGTQHLCVHCGINNKQCETMNNKRQTKWKEYVKTLVTWPRTYY